MKESELRTYEQLSFRSLTQSKQAVLKDGEKKFFQT